jgi:hypothetical protein
MLLVDVQLIQLFYNARREKTITTMIEDDIDDIILPLRVTETGLVGRVCCSGNTPSQTWKKIFLHTVQKKTLSVYWEIATFCSPMKTALETVLNNI